MTEPLPPVPDLSAEEFELLLRYHLDGPDTLTAAQAWDLLHAIDRPVDNPVEEG